MRLVRVFPRTGKVVGEGRDVGGAVKFRDLAGAVFLFLHLVDADHSMDGDAGSVHSGELLFEAFCRGINHQAAALLEYKIFDFDKTVELALTYCASEDLIDLSLVEKNDLENTHVIESAVK
jgi:hypothetical protein